MVSARKDKRGIKSLQVRAYRHHLLNHDTTPSEGHAEPYLLMRSESRLETVPQPLQIIKQILMLNVVSSAGHDFASFENEFADLPEGLMPASIEQLSN